jgi:hypothetical protein
LPEEDRAFEDALAISVTVENSEAENAELDKIIEQEKTECG